MITRAKNNYGRFICDAKDIAVFSANLYKERCIKTIDSALEKMTEGLSDVDKTSNVKDVLPSISDVMMEVIEKYYEDDEHPGYIQSLETV